MQDSNGPIPTSYIPTNSRRITNTNSTLYPQLGQSNSWVNTNSAFGGIPNPNIGDIPNHTHTAINYPEYHSVTKRRFIEIANNVLQLFKFKGRGNYKTYFTVEQACVLASEGKFVILLTVDGRIKQSIEKQLEQILDKNVTGKVKVVSVDNLMSIRGLEYDTVIADPDVLINIIENLI